MAETGEAVESSLTNIRSLFIEAGKRCFLFSGFVTPLSLGISPYSVA
jgi:hypothetical protein